MNQPLAIDLFCGLGGWTEGLLAEGYRVIGFDIERHRYPLLKKLDHVDDSGRKTPVGSNNSATWKERAATGPRDMAILAMRSQEWGGEWEEYPAQLVLQDVLTLHGSQFKDVALIVASPPCQEFSYMAMPWRRGKQIARALRGQDEFPEGYRGSRTIPDLTALFDACFRIQREASAAAGRHIPLVVENVRGAEPWVGRARWSFGSYYLWGDVPALMPKTIAAQKFNPDGTHHGQGSWFAVADSKDRGARKNIGGPGRFDRAAPDSPIWLPSKSPARKAASAKIAKIPFALSSWIARTYRPIAEAA